MTLLAELKTLITDLNIQVETGVFSSTAPGQYVVLTPLVDTYDLYSDNLPKQTIEEVRISLFAIGNYLIIKKQIEKALLSEEITITDRRYISYDADTGYHQIAIDVAKNYEI